MDKQANSYNRLITIEELSVHLGVSKNTIYDWCAVGKIPYIKLGKFLRFDLTKIRKWLEHKQVDVR